ncbi:hypothetical protein C8F01DRAFT_1266152 [Mycena amicta]|nr:hypothetical protein C8F01DRAFT_1266152 [Mycena amicta]
MPVPPPPPSAVQNEWPSHITIAEYQCGETEVKFTACEVREGCRPVYENVFHDNFESCPDACPHCLHGFIQDLDDLDFVYGVLIDCPHFAPDDYANPPLQPNGAVAALLRSQGSTCRTPRGGLIVFKQDRRGRRRSNVWRINMSHSLSTARPVTPTNDCRPGSAQNPFDADQFQTPQALRRKRPAAGPASDIDDNSDDLEISSPRRMDTPDRRAHFLRVAKARRLLRDGAQDEQAGAEDEQAGPRIPRAPGSRRIAALRQAAQEPEPRNEFWRQLDLRQFYGGTPPPPAPAPAPAPEPAPEPAAAPAPAPAPVPLAVPPPVRLPVPAVLRPVYGDPWAEELIYIDDVRPPANGPEERLPLHCCVICSDLFSHPVVLTCGHCYCFRCIRHHFCRDMHCPRCRRVVRTEPQRCYDFEELLESTYRALYPEWQDNSRINICFDGLYLDPPESEETEGSEESEEV